MRRCSVQGCSRKHYANGYCQPHDRRVKKHGDPGGAIKKRARPGTGLAERFAMYTRRMPDGCLEWIAYRMPKGYGQINVDGRVRLATHVAWFLAHGYWPAKGLFVCHKCDNPPCVDADHLFLGTLQDNVDDAVQKGRMQSGDDWRRSHLRVTGEHIADGTALTWVETALGQRMEAAL